MSTALRHVALTAVVSLPPLAEYYLAAFGRIFRAALDREIAAESIFASIYKGAPTSTAPCVPFNGQSWRVYLGGALLNVKPPTALTSVLNPDDLPACPQNQTRAVAVFDDPRVARQCAQLDGDLKRRSAWLYQAEDGRWVLLMRWGAARPGQPSRIRTRPRRRWAICPKEWPRRPDGKPVGTRKAVNLLGQERVRELLKYNTVGV